MFFCFVFFGGGGGRWWVNPLLQVTSAKVKCKTPRRLSLQGHSFNRRGPISQQNVPASQTQSDKGLRPASSSSPACPGSAADHHITSLPGTLPEQGSAALLLSMSSLEDRGERGNGGLMGHTTAPLFRPGGGGGWGVHTKHRPTSFILAIFRKGA